MELVEKVAETIRQLSPSLDDTVVVAVDGCGGAGKSTFARRLARMLDNVAILQTDDFASWDVPLNWWPRLVEQVFEPLSQGKSARYQRYDWGEKQLGAWYEIASGGVLIVEGVSSSRVEFRPYLAYSIWIECPRDVRLARGLERDGEEARALWEHWMAAEDEYAARDKPQNYAQLIINGESF